MASIIDSYLLTNKVAVKFATKLSISIWGTFVLAVFMDLEHPIWAMITGLISFFAAEHAQVVKKCLYQWFSTIVGGVIGVLIMSDASQSPLMAALQVSAVVFVAAAASFNTRDMNVTFCFAILCVTVAIMVMIPVSLTPTTQTLIDIFVDRVGTVCLGTAWACFVSTALWPAFSSDTLALHLKRLVELALEASDVSITDADKIGRDTAALYGCIIDVEDSASHSQFEGAWGRRRATVARNVNRFAIAVASDAPRLRSLLGGTGPEANAQMRAFCQAVEEAKADIAAGRTRAASLRHLATPQYTPDAVEISDEEARERSVRATDLARETSRRLVEMIDMQGTYNRSRRIEASTIRIPRHSQNINALLTGLRSALTFMILFFLWSATDWSQGFLVAVVPVVLSVTFSKLPHADILLKRVCIGSLVGIPPTLFVFVLAAQAPSAIEILLVTGVPVLFLGLMGLSSMMTFAYSLGYCLTFLILLLPQNVPVTDVTFALERVFSVSLGVAVLAILYNVLPRMRTLAPDAAPATPYTHDVSRFIAGGDVSDAQLDRRIAAILDRTVFIITQEAPERRPELVIKAEQGIFLMIHYKRIVEALRDMAPQVKGLLPPKAWRDEVMTNFTADAATCAHPLVPSLEARRVQDGERWEGVSAAQASYLSFEDNTIRETLKATS